MSTVGCIFNHDNKTDKTDNNEILISPNSRRYSNKRSRFKKGPIPMKLRALPESFWQQPNNIPNECPADVQLSPPLPLPLLMHNNNVIEGEPIGSSSDKVPCARTPNQSRETISEVNTDLLFSLFRVVEPRMATIRRKRPTKKRGSTQKRRRLQDPWLVSGAINDWDPTETAQTTSNTTSTVAAALPGMHKTDPNPQNYAQLLSEVVIRL